MLVLKNLHRISCFTPLILQKRMESSTSQCLSELDETQVKLLNENCILVDEKDKVCGSASKLDCHLVSKGPPLHRAFSVFLFNKNNELLMQRRSQMKITFPGFYTNTCCSHPLHNDSEMEEADALGVRRAAQRRMLQELGVRPAQFTLDKIEYITRIHYKAPYNNTFGEHEIDYILFVRGDMDLSPNQNEVDEVTYVPFDGLDSFVKNCANRGIPLTPWFQLILNSHLRTWWKNLDKIVKYCNHNEIIKCA